VKAKAAEVILKTAAKGRQSITPSKTVSDKNKKKRQCVFVLIKVRARLRTISSSPPSFGNTAVNSLRDAVREYGRSGRALF
jgi:cytochrome c peroxidase